MRQPEEETNPDDAAAFDCNGLEPMLPLLQICEAKLENFCKGTLLILPTMLFSIVPISSGILEAIHPKEYSPPKSQFFNILEDGEIPRLKSRLWQVPAILEFAIIFSL